MPIGPQTVWRVESADPASTYDLGSGGHSDLGASSEGQGVTMYDHDDSMSEEEI